MLAVVNWIADNWAALVEGAAVAAPIVAALTYLLSRGHSRKLLADQAELVFRRKSIVAGLNALSPRELRQRFPLDADLLPHWVEVTTNEVIVPVHYATDRQVTGKSSANDYYGSERGPLRYGTAQVSIPHHHTIGRIERPSFWKLQFRENPARHVVLRAIDEVSESVMLGRLRADLAETESRRALVFIHGFNVTFAAAARRGAQMARDLFYIGEENGRALLTTVPILYSWPSNGEAILYQPDSNNADASVPNLQTFITRVAQQSGAEAITIIAHSMGNRTLTNALNLIGLAMPPGQGPLIQEIVLAAPDIDRGVFLGMAAAVKRTGARMTLYASAKDKALQISTALNGFPRLGDARGGVALFSGGDSIDASVVGDDILAHSYYGATDVLVDLHALILQGAAPDGRFGLLGHGVPPNRYWEMMARD